MTCNVAVALELRIAVGGVCVDAAVAPLLLCAHRLYLYQLLHTFVCPVIATSLNPLAGLTLLRAARAKAILTNPYEVPNSVQIVVVPTLLFGRRADCSACLNCSFWLHTWTLRVLSCCTTHRMDSDHSPSVGGR